MDASLNIYGYNYYTIPAGASPGYFISDWGDEYVIVSVPFCYGPTNHYSDLALGQNVMLSFLLEAPNSVVAPGNMVITDGGVNYRVLTTPEMQAVGVGYVMRWKMRYHTSGGLQDSNSNWNVLSLPVNSYPERGVAYWRGINHLRQEKCVYAVANVYNSNYNDFVGSLNAYYYKPDCLFRNLIFYGEVCLVLIGVMNEEFDISFRSVKSNILNIKHPPGFSMGAWVRRLYVNKNFQYNPIGTCTTGNVVRPLHANQGDLVNDGDTSTPVPFDITLSNCPRVNIGYSFVAPTGIGYDDATGVVDLDSTPGNCPGRWHSGAPPQ